MDQKYFSRHLKEVDYPDDRKDILYLYLQTDEVKKVSGRFALVPFTQDTILFFGVSGNHSSFLRVSQIDALFVLSPFVL